jgi:hypothetical protein
MEQQQQQPARDLVAVVGKDVFFLLLRGLSGNDLASVAATCRAWRSLVARYVAETAQHMTLRGPLNTLLFAPLIRSVPSVELVVTSRLKVPDLLADLQRWSGAEGGLELRCRKLVVSQPSGAGLWQPKTLKLLLPLFPSLEWLEVHRLEHSVCARDELQDAFRHDAAKRVAVLLVSSFATGNDAEFVMGRGLERSPQVAVRAAEIQESLMSYRRTAAGCCALAFFRERAGDPQWRNALEARCSETMPDMIEWTRTACSNRRSRHGLCHMWFNCLDCGFLGGKGLCAYCAMHCVAHKGHFTVFQYVSHGAYCDCRNPECQELLVAQ